MNQTTVHERVRQLTDRDEISDLVNRLGVALDEGGFDDMRSLLTDDVTVRTPGGTARGRDAVVAQAARNHTRDERIQHIITNLLIDLADGGDRAEVRANLLVHFAPNEAPTGAGPAPTVTSTQGQIYRFALARTADGWRFAHIESIPVWMSGARRRRPQP